MKFERTHLRCYKTKLAWKSSLRRVNQWPLLFLVPDLTDVTIVKLNNS